jgi:CBS domain-containing protein
MAQHRFVQPNHKGQEDTMKAKDLMTRNPVAVTPIDTIADAAEIMRERKVGMLPVVQNNMSMRLVGVITDRDIATRCVAARHFHNCLVASHMSDGRLVTATPIEECVDVMKKMGRAQVRRIPVVDDGTLLGVIAQADVVRALASKHGDEVLDLLRDVSRASANSIESHSLIL